MNKAKPLVSVIIPSCDRHQLLKRAVESILNKTYPYFEVLIIDNNSEIPIQKEQFEDDRIQIFQLNKKMTASITRNTGLQKAGGEYICFLDDDDFYYPEKLKRQVKYLNEHNDVDFVYSDTVQKDRDKNFLGLQGGKYSFYNLLYYRIIHTNSCLFRRELADDILFNDKMTAFEDVHFFLNIALKFKVAHLPGVVAVWNKGIRPDQLTNRNFRRSYFNWKIICEDFDAKIIKYKEIKKYYYKKMFLLSLPNFDIKTAFISLLKLIK